MNWTNDKPVFTDPCLIVTANTYKGEWEYHLYEIKWWQGYLAWCEPDGEEIGDLEDLKADKYLVLPKH